MSTPNTQLSTLETSMAMLDEIAINSALITSTGNPFSQAITTSRAIQDIRATLTDDVMNQAIMPLMNSKLGFRTDKDPNRPVWKKDKAGKWSHEAPQPYAVSTVRECVIEAILRGLPVVGNCFNIIAENSYTTKEGLWYLIGKRVEGLTDFKISIGVPKMIKPAGDARNASDEEAKGAIVPCFALWKLNGAPDRVEREIPIRVNAQMGADAIMGKAERKILAAAYAQITGTTLGDADASETEPATEMRETKGREVNHASGPQKNPYDEPKAETTHAPVEEPRETQAPVERETAEVTTSPASRGFVNENDERASLMFDIKESLKAAESTVTKFAPILRRERLLQDGVQLLDVDIEALRIIHENREALLNGSFGKEEE